MENNQQQFSSTLILIRSSEKHLKHSWVARSFTSQLDVGQLNYLHNISQLKMSRNQGQRLCSHSLNFDLLSKSLGIYLNHITVSTQNFGKTSTHQRSPFLEASIFGYGLSVRSHPHIHKNSNIFKNDDRMFMKF